MYDPGGVGSTAQDVLKVQENSSLALELMGMRDSGSAGAAAGHQLQKCSRKYRNVLTKKLTDYSHHLTLIPPLKYLNANMVNSSFPIRLVHCYPHTRNIFAAAASIPKNLNDSGIYRESELPHDYNGESLFRSRTKVKR